MNAKNGDPKPKSTSKTLGYSLGGPIGKPGGNNKLFFFYSHEYRPSNNPINGGNPIRLRVPTAPERAGDFSQTLDNNGALFNLIHNPASTSPCTTADTSGCFADGGVLGRIPAGSLYSTGLALLNRYPLPDRVQAANSNYNLQITPPKVKRTIQQPALRLDYQLSSKLRVTGKYAGQREKPWVSPGLIPGFTDVLSPYPFITNYGVTANYTINPTTFLEGTYGFIRNELTGGNEGGVLVNDSANRLNSLPGFPLLYPDAGVVNPRYYAYQTMQDIKPAFWDGKKLNLPPVFGWGGRIGAAPPNQRYPGWLNINRTQDVAVSLTKVAGRHTMKSGFYNNHSFKAQNTGAGGVANLSFQGYVDFGNDTNNALDTGFGYANAAIGVFTQYLQASKFIEGSMIYNNTEFYLQDNWKVTSRLTLDYGMRFTRQQPQYDQFQQMSNFFPEQWKLASAPVLYVAGLQQRRGDLLGQHAERDGPAHRADPDRAGGLEHPGGDRHPDPRHRQSAERHRPGRRRHRQDRLHLAEAGRRPALRRWRTTSPGPSASCCAPAAGSSTTVPTATPCSRFRAIRRSRPRRTCATGAADPRDRASAPQPVPAMVTFQYDAKVPASWQWQTGVQMALPWVTSLDVSYVGNHGYNRLGNLQGGTTLNLNAVDFGDRVPAAVPGSDQVRERRSRGHRLHDEPAAALSRPEQHQPEYDRVLGYLPLDPDGHEPAFPRRLLLRRELRAEPVAQGQYRPAEAPAARRRRDRLGAVRRGRLREAAGGPQPAAPPRQGELRLAAAPDPDPERRSARRRSHHQRLAALGALHGRIRQPLRSRLQLPEQRRQREPDGLARLPGPHRLHGQSGLGAARAISTRSSTRRR